MASPGKRLEPLPAARETFWEVYQEMKILKSLSYLGIWILITFAGKWMAAAGINRYFFGPSTWNFSFHALFLLVPLGWVIVDRTRVMAYGLHPRGWHEDLRTGMVLFTLLIVPPLLADLLTGGLQLAPAAARSGILSALVFLSVFVGFGEELLYRGFFQGEFNRIWGRPFQLRGVGFGNGLILTSVLFGIGHLLNPFNPFRARYGLDWLFFLGTVPLAFLLGLVRERLDGLIAVSLVHLGIVLYVRVFVVTPYSGSVIILSWMAGIAVIIWWVLRRQEGEFPESSEAAP